MLVHSMRHEFNSLWWSIDLFGREDTSRAIVDDVVVQMRSNVLVE